MNKRNLSKPKLMNFEKNSKFHASLFEEYKVGEWSIQNASAFLHSPGHRWSRLV